MDNIYELLGLVAILLFYYFISRGEDCDCDCDETYDWKEDFECSNCSSPNGTITLIHEVDKVYVKEHCQDCDYLISYSEKKD